MMDVILIRHGRARNPDKFAKTCPDDALRPLTRRGRREMKRAARGLARLLGKIDVLAASPLTRAEETASIVAKAFRHLKPESLDQLSPGVRPAAILKWLRQQPEDATVALVGHEPDLSHLATWLVAKTSQAILNLDKGSACCVHFDRPPTAGRGMLRWLISAEQLGRLRGS